MIDHCVIKIKYEVALIIVKKLSQYLIIERKLSCLCDKLVGIHK